jgi:hypothetical protein
MQTNNPSAPVVHLVFRDAFSQNLGSTSWIECVEGRIGAIGLSFPRPFAQPNLALADVVSDGCEQEDGA